jgi:hypothetical protein
VDRLHRSAEPIGPIFLLVAVIRDHQRFSTGFDLAERPELALTATETDGAMHVISIV